MTKKNTIDDMDDLIIHIDEIDVDMTLMEDIYNDSDSCTNIKCDSIITQEKFVESQYEMPSEFKEFEESEENEEYEVKSENVDNKVNESSDQANGKSRKRKKKKRRKNKIITLLIAGSVISGGSTYTYTVYKDFKIEQARLSELDKENLNLKLIINTVDEYGGSDYQLNWKEIASVLSVQTNNYPSLITKNEILNVCSLFLDKENSVVKDLSSVVENLNIESKKKERIFDYNEDLIEYGYTPEKLKLDSSQMKFINSIKKGAFESYNKTKILPSITIAQAILESNWGNSNLVKESNNLFGIKADASWKGDFVTFETKEFHNTVIRDKFRKYSSVSESIIDHAEFLKSNSRYEIGGVFKAKTYKTQAYALQEAGYSTAEDKYGNKTYASMLETLIRQYNLQLLDWEVKHCNS